MAFWITVCLKDFQCCRRFSLTPFSFRG